MVFNNSHYLFLGETGDPHYTAEMATVRYNGHYQQHRQPEPQPQPHQQQQQPQMHRNHRQNGQQQQQQQQQQRHQPPARGLSNDAVASQRENQRNEALKRYLL